MVPVIIREAIDSDLLALTSLTAELGYPDSEEEIGRRFAIISTQPDHKIFVAQEDDLIIGLVSVHSLDILFGASKIGRITALVVNSKYRGKGIGKLLVDKAEEVAKSAGCDRLELTSNNRRIDAHRFYERMGFEGTSTRFVKAI